MKFGQKVLNRVMVGGLAALGAGCSDPGYQGYLNKDEPFGYYSVGAGNPYAGMGYYGGYGGFYGDPYYYYGMPYGMGGYWGDPYVGVVDEHHR
ncbi:hypothetical protein [Methylococcus capsulatus]|uniref:Lipoprotein n=1 Tax=Methylococcus capsulatus TaxID=414 RepID=A0AA35UT54_METCP|nr:hypothetical protein [Methylococcus capsulatus]CAI8880363.1 protein of unknown function [Methylococcus capsulatus]